MEKKVWNPTARLVDKSDDRPQVILEANGRKINTLLDTGANISIISEKVARILKWK